MPSIYLRFALCAASLSICSVWFLWAVDDQKSVSRKAPWQFFPLRGRAYSGGSRCIKASAHFVHILAPSCSVIECHQVYKEAAVQRERTASRSRGERWTPAWAECYIKPRQTKLMIIFWFFWSMNDTDRYWTAENEACQSASALSDMEFACCVSSLNSFKIWQILIYLIWCTSHFIRHTWLALHWTPFSFQSKDRKLLETLTWWTVNSVSSVS